MAVSSAINVAALQSLQGVSQGDAAILAGYSNAGDGGGGVFYWDKGSSTGDNGGTIIVPTGSSSGRWVRIFTGAVNVRWFGAGLGGANDQPAIQSAIEVALHDGVPWVSEQPTLTTGGTVYFPAGNYHITSPFYIDSSDPNVQWVSVRVVGDGKFNTHIYTTGPYSTAVYIGGLIAPNANRIRYCEISNLHFGPIGTPTRLDGTISFPYGGGIGVVISDVYMSGVYRGITCNSLGFFNNVTIRSVLMEGVINCGIYARYGLNWFVSDTIINMKDWTQGTFGVWLDSYSEGWMWNNVFIGLGDACLRATNTLEAPRPPTEHQFHSCNFDEGGRACLWLSNMHRCTFNGCWASSQSSLVGETWGIQNGAILTGACVIDNADVRMVVWTNSTMVNISSYCFWITNAESFAVINSTFSNWGLAGSGYWAIITAPQSHLNFNITGNTFLSDSDFAGNGWRAINIQSGSYNKYVIANNVGYGLNGVGNLAGGGTVLDSGTAHFGKYVPNGGGV